MNIYKAFAPQITKTYAAGEIGKHCNLVYTSSKFGMYMILIIIIPFILRARQIMTLWLGKVPEFAVEFTIVCLFQSMLFAGFSPYRDAVFATGKVGKFIIYSELFHLLALPIGYGFAKRSMTPIPFIIAIVAFDIVYCGFRMLMGRNVCAVPLRIFLKKVVCPIIIVIVIACFTSYLILIYISLPETLCGLILFVIASTILTLLTILLVGINHQERILIKSIINCILRH